MPRYHEKFKSLKERKTEPGPESSTFYKKKQRAGYTTRRLDLEKHQQTLARVEKRQVVLEDFALKKES